MHVKAVKLQSIVHNRTELEYMSYPTECCEFNSETNFKSNRKYQSKKKLPNSCLSLNLLQTIFAKVFVVG